MVARGNRPQFARPVIGLASHPGVALARRWRRGFLVLYLVNVGAVMYGLAMTVAYGGAFWRALLIVANAGAAVVCRRGWRDWRYRERLARIIELRDASPWN